MIAAGPETAVVWYVYGVVARQDGAARALAEVPGLDAPPVLVADGDLAAIAAPVPAEDFGEEALESKLRDPGWLEAQVRLHDAVLAAVLPCTTPVPFRFGTLFGSPDQIRAMLRERRDLAPTLARVRGAVELGVKAFVDPQRFRAERAEPEGARAEQASSGTAYLQRRQSERRLAEAWEELKASCANHSHRQLTGAAEAGLANPIRAAEETGRADEMVLNGAYLVRSGRVARFRAVVAALEADFDAAGAAYELTGPWPPYNFVDTEDG